MPNLLWLSHSWYLGLLKAKALRSYHNVGSSNAGARSKRRSHELAGDPSSFQVKDSMTIAGIHDGYGML